MTELRLRDHTLWPARNRSIHLLMVLEGMTNFGSPSSLEGHGYTSPSAHGKRDGSPGVSTRMTAGKSVVQSRPWLCLFTPTGKGLDLHCEAFVNIVFAVVQ